MLTHDSRSAVHRAGRSGLVKTFADQAVIAMENARLLANCASRSTSRRRPATCCGPSAAPRSSLEAVLDALVETVARLCRADQAYMFRRRDELHHLVASHGLPDEAIDYLNANPFEPNEGTISGRVVLHGRTIHIHDVLQDEKYTYSGGQKTAGFRTMLGIPLMAQDNMVGVFVVARTRVEPFTDKEIALASGFADQAVIAIENARLFEELRDRQAELRVTFDNMGDGVVMFDADLRLAAWNRNFQQLLDVPDDFLASRPGLEDYVRLLVERGELGDRDRQGSGALSRPRDPAVVGRAHAARRAGPRGAQQPGAGRRRGADLQRHHQAQAGRGRDPLGPRRGRGGAGAADRHGRHPEGHRQFADRCAARARCGGQGGGTFLRRSRCSCRSARRRREHSRRPRRHTDGKPWHAPAAHRPAFSAACPLSRVALCRLPTSMRRMR